MTKFLLQNDRILIRARMVPWDTIAFGFPVGQIDEIQLFKLVNSQIDYRPLDEWIKTNSCRLVACRLRHDQLKESFFLEQIDFRFIEMVLHPNLRDLGRLTIPDQGLEASEAQESDLYEIAKIAENAFKNERFHLDPRLDLRLANLRYARWAENSFNHSTQKLIKITEQKKLIAFFVIELINEDSIYWHLTAIAPEHQGKGYGRRTWLSMMNYHKNMGIKSISTTISARNVPVLNLYSSLNFRFLPPEMTFHWMEK